MWLEVASTNNDPSVVAHYFVDCVEQVGGCPQVVRADCGTENVTIAGIQRFFRRNDNDSFAGFKSFMYGKSTSNQRIEAWWSFLKKSASHWWINQFKDLRDAGAYCDSYVLHRGCLSFCFMDLIQKELNAVARNWNMHRIRPYPNQRTPPGKPDVLYFLPELNDSSDFKTAISFDDTEVSRDVFCKPKQGVCQPEFLDVFQMIMQENGLSMPDDIEEAKDLYVQLVSLVEAEF